MTTRMSDSGSGATEPSNARFGVAVPFEFEQSGFPKRRMDFSATIRLPDQSLG